MNQANKSFTIIIYMHLVKHTHPNFWLAILIWLVQYIDPIIITRNGSICISIIYNGG